MSYLHGSKTTAIGVLWRHTHAWTEDRRRRCRAVRGAGWARVVLRTTPAQANTRVADRIALHLVDGHFRGMTLHELDETASLAWGDLDVGNLAEALEEGAELILGDVARKAANEDGGIVRVRELVHGLGRAIVAHWGSAHGVHAHARAATLLRHAHTTGTARTTALVLGGSSGNAHGAVATVDALHLGEGLLLVLLAGESHEAVAAGHSADGVGHDLGGFGGWIAVLEELYEDEFGDFGSKVADEDAVLGSALIAAISWVSQRPCARWLPGVTHLRSARPPPEAQLSLKGRLELGINWPLRERALAAASALAKSTKQYPALLLFCS